MSKDYSKSHDVSCREGSKVVQLFGGKEDNCAELSGEYPAPSLAQIEALWNLGYILCEPVRISEKQYQRDILALRIHAMELIQKHHLEHLA